MQANWKRIAGEDWTAPDRFVCLDCIEDPYLWLILAGHSSSSHICNYCGGRRAAPISTILAPIGKALDRYCPDPGSAAVGWQEGDWLIPPITTSEALKELKLSCPSALFSDIATAFHNNEWIPCNRYFPNKHENEELLSAWEEFEELAKHRTRYFLESKRRDTQSSVWLTYDSADKFLENIGRIAIDLNLLRQLDKGTDLYRARIENKCAPYDTFEDLGAPPKELARAGRMNAAGIPYLYTSMDQITAASEVVNSLPAQISIGKFHVIDRVTILDLVTLPIVPSIFEVEEYEKREALLFINEFIRRIANPISKDGKEHVEYVPSQIVSEFFAQVFTWKSGERAVGGIVYPSTTIENGENIVLFPPRNGAWEKLVRLVVAERWEMDSNRLLRKRDD